MRVLHLRLSLVKDTLLTLCGLRLLGETVSDVTSTGQIRTVPLISDVDIGAATFALIPHSVIPTCN